MFYRSLGRSSINKLFWSAAVDGNLEKLIVCFENSSLDTHWFYSDS